MQRAPPKCQLNQCPNYKIAKEFLVKREWPVKLSDPRFDRCYCESCYPSDLQDTSKVGGSTYVVPRGFTRFGVQIEEGHFNYHNIWKEWANCYHGTSIVCAKSVIEHRSLLLPGEVTLEGKEIKIPDNHIKDQVYFFTTPSINYASEPVYASSYDYKYPKHKNIYKITVVLQCKQKRGSFVVQPETILYPHEKKSRICPFIKNEAMEWKSNQRASIIPYGLLLSVCRVEKYYEQVECPYCFHPYDLVKPSENQGVVVTCTNKRCKLKLKPFSCPHCHTWNALCSHTKEFDNDSIFTCRERGCGKDIFISKCPECSNFNFCKISKRNDTARIECSGKNCKERYTIPCVYDQVASASK